MNEDFGVGKKRRRVTDFDFVPRQAHIDISKYQPATKLQNSRQTQAAANNFDDDAIAIAADDPAWNRLTMADPIEDSSGNNYDEYDDGSLNSNDEGSAGNKSDKDPDQNDKERWYRRLWNKIRGLSRKQWLIIGGILLILIAGATSYALTRPDADPPAVAKAKKKVAPAPPPPPTSPLTGIDVSEEDKKRPVVGVMIENSPDSRPQSGLQQAGVVFEAIAEYGITRFLALYQEANPANLGPVRSARPYYVDWAKSFEASYAHVGGSPDALAKIKVEGIRDLDQFANSGAYRRISQRYAPHNVYTTMNQLRDLTAAKGWTGSNFKPFERKKDAKAKQVTAQTIDMNISGPTYNVHYDYDPASNTYLRTMGGGPHADADSGTRIAPKVVIGMATQHGKMPDGYHSTYGTTGTGVVKIFQDGTVTEGTWKRADGETYQFFDAGGKTIALNPGQAWITVVGDPAAITFAGAPTPAPAP